MFLALYWAFIKKTTNMVNAVLFHFVLRTKDSILSFACVSFLAIVSCDLVNFCVNF